MLDELRKIFHSNIKSLEILYVLEGTKPCARILVSEDSAKETGKFLEGRKLNFSVSDFKLLKEKGTGLYSDKSTKIQKDDRSKGYFVYCVSKDGSCKLAKSFEANLNHINLGLILGYPRCCAEFFEKNFSSENTDLTLDAFSNSYGFDFLFPMNICARHFDISLLSHFPCSFGCLESLKIANGNLEMIKRHSPKLADVFTGTLKSAVVYTKNGGIFLLRNPRIKGDEIYYEGVLGTVQDKMFYLLSSAKKLKILDKNNFSVGDEKIKEAAMVFS